MTNIHHTKGYQKKHKTKRNKAYLIFI